MPEYKLSITLVYDHDGPPLTRREKLALRMAVAQAANREVDPRAHAPRVVPGSVYFAPTFDGDLKPGGAGR